MPKMQRYAVFDIQEMPERIKRIIFDRERGHSNDSYIDFYWEDYSNDKEEDLYEDEKKHKAVQDWMIAQGLTEKDVEETQSVLIKYWW